MQLRSDMPMGGGSAALPASHTSLMLWQTGQTSFVMYDLNTCTPSAPIVLSGDEMDEALLCYLAWHPSGSHFMAKMKSGRGRSCVLSVWTLKGGVPGHVLNHGYEEPPDGVTRVLDWSPGSSPDILVSHRRGLDILKIPTASRRHQLLRMMDFPPGFNLLGVPDSFEARWSPDGGTIIQCSIRALRPKRVEDPAALAWPPSHGPQYINLMPASGASTHVCCLHTSGKRNLRWPRWPSLPKSLPCCFLPATSHLLTDPDAGFILQAYLPAQHSELSPDGRLLINLMVGNEPHQPIGEICSSFKIFGRLHSFGTSCCDQTQITWALAHVQEIFTRLWDALACLYAITSVHLYCIACAVPLTITSAAAINNVICLQVFDCPM